MAQQPSVPQGGGPTAGSALSEAAENLVVSPFFESHRPTLATRVRDVMETQVVVAHLGDTIGHVARLLRDHRFGGLPVVDAGNRVVGVVSETDLLYRLKVPTGRIVDALTDWLRHDSGLERRKALAHDLQGVMTHPAVTVHADATLQEAASLMIDRRCSRLPVVEGDRLVGLLTRRHVISAILAWAELHPE